MHQFGKNYSSKTIQSNIAAAKPTDTAIQIHDSNALKKLTMFIGATPSIKIRFENKHEQSIGRIPTTINVEEVGMQNPVAEWQTTQLRWK